MKIYEAVFHFLNEVKDSDTLLIEFYYSKE